MGYVYWMSIVHDALDNVMCEVVGEVGVKCTDAVARVSAGSLINKAWRACAWLLSVCACRISRLLVKKKEARPVELPIGEYFQALVLVLGKIGLP